MLPNAERLVRARLVLERRGIAAEDFLAAEVSSSWSRCLDAGLDPQGTPQKVVIEEAELRRRRERIGHIHHLALAEIETLYHQIAGSNFLIAFADAEGVIIAIMDMFPDDGRARYRSGAPAKYALEVNRGWFAERGITVGSTIDIN